jgi:hypothetical protein
LQTTATLEFFNMSSADFNASAGRRTQVK